MARLPQYVRQNLPSGIPQAPRETGQSGFAQASGVVEQSMMQLGEETRRIEQAERATKVSDWTAKASQELMQFSYDLQSDPDFETHKEKYDKKVEEIYAGAEKGMADKISYGVFRKEFAKISLSQAFDVQNNANKKRVDRVKAGLAMDLDTFADLAGQTQDPVMANTMTARGKVAIETAFQSGAIGAEEAVVLAQKYTDGIAASRVRWDLLRDPEGTEQRILSGQYPDLSAEKQAIWLERASAKVEANQRARLAEAERQDKLADKAEKAVQEEFAKEGARLEANGEMTADWIEANRERLSVSDYKALYKGLGEDTAKTDPMVYSSLKERALRGENVLQEAKDAYVEGALGRTEYDSIFSMTTAENVPTWLEQGAKFISGSLAVSDLNPDPAAAQRKANALDDWQRWGRENPEASWSEAEVQYKRIVKESAIIDTSQITLTMRAPTFLVGGRNAPDIAGTEAATVAAYEAGEIDAREFAHQAELIKRWRDALGDGETEE